MTEIHQRYYDNPLKEDGTEKPNRLLGIFEITQKISEDGYSSINIGTMKGDKYLILEYEVSGFNGGSRWEIHKLDP